MRERWAFRALDTLFFRDGTPFQQGEQGSVYPRSLFPPPMMTLQGAIRTALARSQGWTPKNKKWPKELGTVQDLGQLQLGGPYLQFKKKRLYPAPLILFGKEGSPLVRLILGDQVWCDLSDRPIRLPQLPDSQKGGAPLQVWLTKEGMETVLKGGIPADEQMIYPDQLWQQELRVGIGRDNQTRRIVDGQLYTITHVRPHHDLEVVVEVDDIPESWHTPEQLNISLGGEGRVATVKVSKGRVPDLPAIPEFIEEADGRIRYTISLITPSRFHDIESAVTKGELEVPSGIPGECVSASIGKAIQVGGWDSLNQRPLPLKPLLPTGSTWFFEANKKDLEQIRRLHGAFCGKKSVRGMGQIVIGTWNK